MSVEPHPGRYLANTDGALRLLEHVDHKAMGINFDPSHTFPMGDYPNITVYRLGRNIIHIHASDNDGVTNVHWRPGMGKIDWHAMFLALKDIGYDGTVSIELEDVPGVSRGKSNAPGVYRNEVATEEFVAETVAGMNYLKDICKEVGISGRVASKERLAGACARVLPAARRPPLPHEGKGHGKRSGLCRHL